MTTAERPSCNVGWHHGLKEWHECPNCSGEGTDGHDCGEDCCVCLHPDDNVRCDFCGGRGGIWRCYTCTPVTEDEMM